MLDHKGEDQYLNTEIWVSFSYINIGIIHREIEGTVESLNIGIIHREIEGTVEGYYKYIIEVTSSTLYQIDYSRLGPDLKVAI